MKRLVLLCFLVTSCGSLYKVSTTDNEGIPFLNQEVIETETKIYRESFFKVELVQEWEKTEINTIKDKNGKYIPKVTKSKYKTTIVRYGTITCGLEINTLFSSKSNVDEAQGVVQKPLISVPSAAGPNSKCTFRDKLFDYQTPTTLLNNSPSNGLDFSTISMSKTQSVRPSPKQYYINVKKAVSGSSQATITLNSNGTLASAAATVEDDLVGKIIDKIPLTEIISSTLNLPAAGEEESEGESSEGVELVSISLKLVPIHRDYILTRDDEPNSKTVMSATNLTSFKIRETKGELLIKEEPKKDDKKEAIAISGSIVLPKKDK